MMNAFREQKWAKLRAACRALAFDDAHRWSIEVKRRKTGHSVGNFDAYYVLDDDATKRYRSLKDVERKVLEEQKLVKKEKKTTTTLTTTTLTTTRTKNNTDATKEEENEKEEEEEEDEPVCPRDFLKTTTTTTTTGGGRPKVFASATGHQRVRQQQQQQQQRAFLPGRPRITGSNSNTPSLTLRRMNSNNSTKTHSRLHNSYVAISPRTTEDVRADDNTRRRDEGKQRSGKKKKEETRGQDWRISNPIDAEEAFEKEREAYLNRDPEVARERQMLKERYRNTDGTSSMKSKGNNKRREKNTLPSKYEHLALVFNGLNMYRELLRMRNSAETVENICACAQNLVKRDVRLEHLRKIETVKPGTFGFTKKKNKRDAIINAIDTNHRSEGPSFVDPESVRLEILEERTIGLDDGDKVEEVKDDGDNNIEKGDKRRAISDKERERAREVDFHSRLMRLCDEAHVAFCKKHGISISPSSNVPEQTLWHETFDVEIEAPDIVECAVCDASLLPSAGVTAATAAATTAPPSMLLHTPKPPSSASAAFPLSPLVTTTTASASAAATTTTMKKKIVTERDIDEAVRQMQMENGGMDGREHDDLENEGISRQHIRRVLERKFEKDCFHSPSAVALRAETKIKQNLPRIFDLVHSLFATSRKRVFAFEDLLNKTHEQLKAKDIGGLFYSRDEIEDCMRTLAKTCSEWCTIERAQDGEELFRVLVVSSSTRTEFLPRSSSIRRRAPSTPAPSATMTKNDRCSTPRGGGGGGGESLLQQNAPKFASSPVARRVKQKLLHEAGAFSLEPSSLPSLPSLPGTS